MTPDDYARVRRLYDQVVDLAADQRLAHLRDLSADRQTIAEVMALVAAAESDTFSSISKPLSNLLASLNAPILKPGDVLGVWRIEREIGQGGMGSVFLVERQDGHFSQTAALKFVKGLPHADTLNYFTRERQLLAMLTHPNIARLLDGGASSEGQPYLVMEYINGVAIDAYCQAHGLSTAQILKLFTAACDAVAFAHRQLIVHCDLKPSNLLINQDARPILLDFGIARLLGLVGVSAEQAVEPRAAAFTPRYASPEQRGQGLVSTVSDIYSLGVMLGELIGVKANLNVELAAILDKATAADPGKRYVSVDAFTDDIARLDHQMPLQALPHTAHYVAKKFLQRRLPLVLAGVVFAATVAGFTTKVMVESRRAIRAEQNALESARAALAERDRATAAETATKQTNDFLVSVFDATDPNASSGDIPASTLLTAAEARIETEMQRQPQTQAELFAVIGKVRRNMGSTNQAQKNYQRAIELERGQQRPLVLAQMLADSARLELDSFGSPEALLQAREALALREKHAAPASEALADSLALLGYVLLFSQANLKESGALIQRSLAIRQRHDLGSVATGESLYFTGLHAAKLLDYPRAIALLKQGLAIRVRVYGAGHPKTLLLQDDLATAFRRSGQLDEAEAIFRRVLALRQKLLGRDSEITLRSLALLASTLAAKENYREAVRLNEEGLSIAEKVNGRESVVYSVFLSNLALQQSAIGVDAVALERMRVALRLARTIYPANAPTRALMERNLGVILRRAQQPTAAAKQLLLALEANRRMYGDEHPEVATVRVHLAEVSVDLGQLDDARARIAALERMPKAASAAQAPYITRLQARIAAAETRDAEALRLFVLAEKMITDRDYTAKLESWLFKLPRLEFMASRGIDNAARAASAVLVLQKIEGIVDPKAPVLADLRRLMKI